MNAEMVGSMCLMGVLRQSYFAWLIQVLGPTCSVLLPAVGVGMFVGACLVVVRRSRLSVIASYLVLVPLPFLIALHKAIASMMNSLALIAVSEANVSAQQTAGAVNELLVPLFFALLVTWPTYVVLTIGLLVRSAAE